MKGGVATLPTTLSAGLDCGDRGPLYRAHDTQESPMAIK